MPKTVTSKGQVTIPKKVRDALHLLPGNAVEFDVNKAGEIVLRKVGSSKTTKRAMRDRFSAVRGTAQIRWRTSELMALLRD